MYTTEEKGGGGIIQFSDLVRFGFSPSMLFKRAFTDESFLLTAYHRCCSLPEFDAMESFLPADREERTEILGLLRTYHKVLNYNTPGYFQLDGPFNTCSDDPGTRQGAFEDMKRHLGYAAEAGSPVFIVTGCPDKGEGPRAELKARYEDFFLRLCAEADRYSIRVLLEPIERHRFKKLLYGPTAECAAFIRAAREKGAANSGLMMDIAHLPLMEESQEDAIRDSGEIGFEHVHLGEAVLDPDNPFYGHTHPPLEARGALFSQQDLEDQFERFMRCGFIRKDGPRASISLEVSPYPGTREETSIRLMYEKCVSAFYAAADRALQ